MNIEIKKVREGAVIPKYATEGAAGLDLVAHIDAPIYLRPGEQVQIGTGIAINIKDPSIACQLLPRSGLGTKHGIVLANSVGLCDSDYQGEYLVTLLNRNNPYVTNESFTINPGDRIAQAVFIRVEQVTFTEVEQFSEVTERGEGGHGSTGLVSSSRIEN